MFLIFNNSIVSILTLLKMALFGAAHGWVGVKGFPLTKMSHIYLSMMKLRYALPKEDTKNITIT